MRRFVIYLLTAFAVLAIVTGAILAIRARGGRVTRTGASPQDVEAAVPYDIYDVSHAVSSTFSASKTDTLSSRFLAFDLHSASDPIFPDDYQLQTQPDNQGLARYVAIDPAARKRDFYLTPPAACPPDSSGNTDCYWESEYQYQGQPAKFRCSFIIHLEPQSKNATRISILEYLPEVWAGKEFAILGHAGPGFYRDIRTVPPTNLDRVDVLKIITRSLPGTIENKPQI